ncbi:MAG: hypothetical protein CME15_15550 [Gemmatimonadetes bacterium]|jgi:uncharacterized protein YjbI with pentapeptide repeats|nr:hypothetical protein [Gemmatimonadota bacterium]
MVTRCQLPGENLENVDLQGGYLREPDLRRARIQDAQLAGAEMKETELEGPILIDAVGLSLAQTGAIIDETIRLPIYL